MGSLLGSGKDIEVRYQLCSYLKTTGDPYDSGVAGWEAIFDDLDYLATGIDEDGKAIACVDDIDWGGIMIFGCADMEQLCLPWGLPGYHEDEPCFECDCNRSDKPYTSLVRVSRLRRLGLLPMFSETTFRSRCNSVHPLVHSIYFNSQFPKLDLMHVIDHRGKAGCVAASVLIDLVRRENRLGRIQADRLAKINELLKEWNRNHLVSSAIGHLELQNLTQENGWAMLHGPYIKAANTRHLLPFVESLCLRFYDVDDEYCKSVKEVVCRLNCVFAIVYDSDMFPTETQLATLTEAVDELGWHFQNLRHLCEQKGWLLFPIWPKSHYLMHIPDQAGLINPQCVQNYISESLVGVMTKIWRSTASGPYDKVIQRSVQIRYLVMLSIELGL